MICRHKTVPPGLGKEGSANPLPLGRPHHALPCAQARPRVRARRGAARLRRGFTVVELMVLMVIIGILAGIIIPQILAATRRSNESALRGDLNTLRIAIERFQADCGGYPPRLDDILAWTGDHVSAQVDGSGRNLDLESYRGPYLRTGDMLLPRDPFTDLRDWQYDSATGAVHSNCDAIGRDGTPYSSW
jgi:general secretion pathway protein G